MEPVVSVIVTCDYESGKPEAWNALRAALAGLARQDFQEPAEFLLVESAEFAPRLPSDLKTILPSLRVVTAPASSASELKNAGVRAASAELVAMIDGDCIAEPGWLRQLVNLLRRHPEVSAVSGRTHYGRRRFLDRAMALIARSYLDAGCPAPTRHLSPNNSGFRRSVLLSHPYPRTGGAHTSNLQSAAIMSDGGGLLFDPGLSVEHDYGGWPMEREIRRSMGYGVIQARLLDRRVPYARLARLGYFSIPLFMLLRTLHAWWNCVRRARLYGVAWYELPAVFVLAAAACAMEAPGMLHAVRGQPFGKTSFR